MLKNNINYNIVSSLQSNINKRSGVAREKKISLILTKDLLYNLYVEKQLSVNDISLVTGIPHTTILRRLKKCSIPSHDIVISQKIRVEKIGGKTKGRKDICDKVLIKMYKKGFSAAEIARNLKCPQVTVSRRLKKHKIQIRPFKQYISKEKNYRFLSLAQIPPMMSQKTQKERIARASLLGHVLSDGCVSFKYQHGNYRLRYFNADIELTEEFVSAIKTLYGSHPKIKEKIPQKKNWKKQYIAEFHSKIVAYQVFNEIRSIKKIKFKTPKEKKVFIRAIFDDEGSILIQKGKHSQHPSLEACNTKKILLLKTQKLLSETFGINTHLYPVPSRNPKHKKLWRLYTHVGKDIIKFRDRIGFTSKRKQKKLEDFCKFREAYFLGYYYPKTTIKRVIKLFQEGHKLAEVTRITGMKKTTIAHWYEKFRQKKISFKGE